MAELTCQHPFCGCGTAIHAAQKLDRHWIGIDVTHLAVSLIERRLTEAFPGIDYEVQGIPTDVAGARDLSERDKHEFQKWITARIGAQPYKGGRKGMDRGIDGYLPLNDPTREMEREAAAAGLYETGGMKVPRLQILTAAQILDGRRPQVPFGFTEGFKVAEREAAKAQPKLL